MSTNKSEKWIVITTINPPTPAIEVVSRLCIDSDWSAVVVGDTKTPEDWQAPGIDFLSIKQQYDLFPEFARLVPTRHYCRKNLGYLYAIQHGAKLILETDDDNIPGPDFGYIHQLEVSGDLVNSKDWVNVYRYFTKEHIWPRGLPLDTIHNAPLPTPTEATTDCLVQQFLADEDPDVDAVYRLVLNNPVTFDKREKPVILEPGTWCPFNTQNTLIFAEAFPLLYLPCHVSFRMTDIWRSFVMQAALWAKGQRVAFRNATVRQERNAHDFNRDFEDEIPGYLHNEAIRQSLESELDRITSDGSPLPLSEIMLSLWNRLIHDGFVPEQEREILQGWTRELN